MLQPVPPAGNSFFNLGQPSPQPQVQQRPQPAQPAQSGLFVPPSAPRTDENEPMYAVDMMNPMNVPQAPAQQPLPPAIPNMPPSAAGEQRVDPAGIFDPMAPSHAQNPGFVPIPQARSVPQAWHSRGPELIAPSPPSADGQAAPNQMIRVQQTTRPTDMSRTVEPRQHLDVSLKGMPLIESVALSDELSERLKDVCGQYAAKDKLGFTKNSVKLADLLVHVADRQEVAGLLPEDAVAALERYLEAMARRDYAGAQRDIVDYSRHADGLNKWAGQLKLMAIALGK